MQALRMQIQGASSFLNKIIYFIKTNITAMKKILILTSILIVSFTSMSFKGCPGNGFAFVLDALWRASHGSLLDKKGDGITEINYSIYVGDNGTIIRSSGETNIIFEQKTSGTTQRFNSLRTSSSDADETVLAVGNNGTIVRSTNTGNNWIVTTPVTSANLYGTDFDGNFSFAVGDNGTLLRSTDDGETWSQVSSGTTRNLKAIGIHPLFTGRIVAAGEKGVIIRSTNGGLNWTNVSLTDTTVTFYDISKVELYHHDGNNFCIAGTGGRIYKSTDDGATWTQKPSGTTNTLRSIYRHTRDSIVVAGDNGTIRFSTDEGETWFTDPYFNSPSTRNFKSVSLVNRDHYTFSALSDTIWFVSNEPITLGLNNINTAIPQAINLHQNYPNPFNPATKIGFELPKSSIAKLTVYDLTGKEIKTLVNENLHAGVYEYEWTGISLPSGVYFYKLEADNFTQTRKMMLIK